MSLFSFSHSWLPLLSCSSPFSYRILSLLQLPLLFLWSFRLPCTFSHTLPSSPPRFHFSLPPTPFFVLLKLSLSLVLPPSSSRKPYPLLSLCRFQSKLCSSSITISPSFSAKFSRFSLLQLHHLPFSSSFTPSLHSSHLLSYTFFMMENILKT